MNKEAERWSRFADFWGCGVRISALLADFGRSYGVIAAHLLRLKAIAAMTIWALALASPA
jgi:hypothetical protein